MDWANQTSNATRLDHTVSLADSTLRLRPVFDAASTDVTIEGVCFDWQIFSISLRKSHSHSRSSFSFQSHFYEGHTIQIWFLLCFSHLMRRLIDKSDVLWTDCLDHSLSAEASSATNIHHLDGLLVES